ncbi:MAG: hypothetical protein V1899_05590 [Planctomycetota bacterium]
MPSPNLFEALFKFHPRERLTPKENFLTEAFAYILKTDEVVRECWLSKILGREVKGVKCHIKTQQTEIDDGSATTTRPDMLLHGELQAKQPFTVYCEHKWDSDCDLEQLRRYNTVAEKYGKHARLIFIGATHYQRDKALNILPAERCFLWEDVFAVLEGVSGKSDILKELLQFMKTQGLGPSEPITVSQMQAFLIAGGFENSLMSLTNKLNTNFSWEVIPKRFHAKRYVHDAYGRVAIRFETPDWKPAMSLGFLYDEKDHRVSFVDRNRGIDLLLRIEVEPRNSMNAQPALDVLDEKRCVLNKAAASVLLKGEYGNGNNYSLLIVRDCLADVIKDTQSSSDQLNAIHSKLVAWLEILFKDGKLEAAFKKSSLDSGMSGDAGSE